MFKTKPVSTRKHKRLLIYRLLSYEGDQLGEPVFCNLNNISEGGVLFTSNESLELGAVLKLNVLLPSGEEPLVAVGEVVRISKVDDKKPERYKIACSFKQISDGHRHEIVRLIDGVSSSKFAHKFIDEYKKSWRRK